MKLVKDERDVDMARDRYLWNDNEGETIHRNEIKADTPKSKWENFWYYYKIHVIVILAGCCLVGAFIYEMATKINPDYEIAVLTTQSPPVDFADVFGKELEQYGYDLNGDGRVSVQINSYVLGGEDDDMVDPNQQMASVTRFTVDLSEGSSIIYITDEESFSNNQWFGEDFFAPLDGDEEKQKISWADCKGLEKFDPDFSTNGWSEEQFQEWANDLSVSIRRSEGTSIEGNAEKEEYYQNCLELFENIRNGTAVQE